MSIKSSICRHAIVLGVALTAALIMMLGPVPMNSGMAFAFVYLVVGTAYAVQSMRS